MRKPRAPKRELAFIDSETDPFEFGAEIKPFVWGFLWGDDYREFWGDSLSSCSQQLVTFLESITTPLILYAHNGGKFDFMFFLQEKLLDPGEMLLINGRIVKARLGIHELRDSYAIVPVALEQYQKDEIDYAIFRRDVRHLHRKKISAYLKKDCVYLGQLVSGFVAQFGTKLTIGATAINQLSKLHPVVRLDSVHDATFRPFYFGGRVQCFQTGIHKGPFKIFDVNSMYPDVMRNELHPMGAHYMTLENDDAAREFDNRTGKLRRFPSSPYFMQFFGAHKGCLPTRTKNDGLSFEPAVGEFFVCSHELRAGIELGLIEVIQPIKIHVPNSYLSFDAYVDKYSAVKIEAKARKKACELAENHQGAIDAHRDELFAKLLLNSAYGKFATNPENFKCWFLRECGGNESTEYDFALWLAKNTRADVAPELEYDFGSFEIWTVPAEVGERSYFDVATAASITSAARAKLMRAIAGAYRPLYCDTDSLICEGLTGQAIHDSELGAWKLEKATDLVAIAGKKLYAAFTATEPPGNAEKKDKHKLTPTSIGGVDYWCLKLASKGFKATPSDILAICQGATIEWASFAPNFKLDGSTHYVERKIKSRVPIDGARIAL